MIQVKCDNSLCRFNIEGICNKVFLRLFHDTDSRVSNKLICDTFEVKITK